MMKRFALMTVLLVAPLALNPSAVDAQEQGIEQARAASANAQATGRPTALPPGMQNRPAGQALPPGLMLTREAEPEAEPAPETGGEEPQEECATTIEIINGVPTLVDCHGTVIG